VQEAEDFFQCLDGSLHGKKKGIVGSSKVRLLVLSLREDLRFTRVTINSIPPPSADRPN